MADAGGAFVTRAFEKLLKDASHRKYANLQDALKAYLGEKAAIYPELQLCDNMCSVGSTRSTFVRVVASLRKERRWKKKKGI